MVRLTHEPSDGLLCHLLILRSTPALQIPTDLSHRFSKGILDLSDPWPFCRHPLGGQDLHHIEAGLKQRGVLLKVKLRRSPQPLLLAAIHLLCSGSEAFISPQLHLHKAEKAPLLRHQIQLSETAPPAGSYDPIPFLPQKFRRKRLSPAAPEAAILPTHRFFKKDWRWMGLGPYCRSIS